MRPTPSPSTVYIYELAIKSIKELGGASIMLTPYLIYITSIRMGCNLNYKALAKIL
jgi:hypothetical protein